MKKSVVVVGASVAGVRSVQALRAEGFGGDLVLVGAESQLPYDKPPLSKGVLLDEVTAAEIGLTSVGELETLGVLVLLGSPAVALEPRARLLHLQNGHTVHYDDLVIATGASARPAPWSVTSGLYLLRTWDDATALRTRLAAGCRLVVIGGGLIGSEVAGAARIHDCEVAMVDVQPAPLARSFGLQLAERLTRLHNDQGITTYLGEGVRSVEGEEGDLLVVLDDGTELQAEAVVAGLGCIPNVDWLQDSGLSLDNGVVCDSTLQAAPHVYAIGDVARWPHPGSGSSVRVEHWTNAVDQARYVARVLTADRSAERFEPSDYVWTDQFDWKIKAVGSPRPGGHTTIVGDLDVGRPVVAAVHSDSHGVACGGVAVNWPAALVRIRRLVDGTRLASEMLSTLERL